MASPTPDAYTTNEDQPFTTGLVAVSPFKSSWRYFEGMDRIDDTTVAADTTQYPVDAEGDMWFETDHDYGSPNFSTWKTGNAPFATSNANEGACWRVQPRREWASRWLFPTGGVLGPRGTIIDGRFKGPNTKVTFLMRREFEVTAEMNPPPLTGQISLLIDDGARFYIDGVPVCLVRQPAPNEFNGCATEADNLDLPITSTSEAAGAPSETTIRNYTIDFANIDGLGGVLALDVGTHTLAVEVHNDSTGSTDLGAEVQLSISGGDPGVADNDSPVGSVSVALVDDAVDSTNPAIDAGAVVMLPDGNFTYTPAANYSGTARFTYTITDNTGTSAPVEVLITVNSVNDAPIANADFYAGPEGEPIVITETSAPAPYLPAGSLWAYSDDETDQDTLNPDWKGPPSANFEPVGAGWLTGDAPFGNADQPITTMITYTAPATYYFWTIMDITGPIPNTLGLSLRRDDCAVIYINGVEAYRSGTGGQATLPAGQNFTTLCTGAAVGGADEQAYFDAVIDATNLNLTPSGNTISVEVHQLGSGSTDISFDLEISSGDAGLLANDSDADDTDLTAVADDTSQVDAAGTFTLNPDGTFTFDPDAGVSGNFTFTYHVTDGTTDSNIATVTISISPDPNRPDAVDDAYTVSQGGTLATDTTSVTYLPRASADWSYFDEMTNGQSPDGVAPATPIEQYPLDAQGDAWYENDFDTASSDAAIGAWKVGGGALGAGTIDGAAIVTTLLGNDVTLGAPNVNNTSTTYLFRRMVNIPDGATRNQLAINLLADDGGILYVNGTEAFRYNMDPGAVDSTTVALGAPSESYLPFQIDVDGLLVDGDNLFAFELHQVNTTSSDVGFDLEVRNVLGVLTNDTDPQGDPLTAVLVDGPDNAATFRWPPTDRSPIRPTQPSPGPIRSPIAPTTAPSIRGPRR